MFNFAFQQALLFGSIFLSVLLEIIRFMIFHLSVIFYMGYGKSSFYLHSSVLKLEILTFMINLQNGGPVVVQLLIYSWNITYRTLYEFFIRQNKACCWQKCSYFSRFDKAANYHCKLVYFKGISKIHSNFY